MSRENFSLRGWWGAGTAAQRSCGCPIPGGTQDQIGWGPGQPDPVNCNPYHDRGLELNDLWGPFQSKIFSFSSERSKIFFFPTTSYASLLNYINPLNFLLLFIFLNPQIFLSYGLTSGGQHSPCKTQWHNEICRAVTAWWKHLSF